MFLGPDSSAPGRKTTIPEYTLPRGLWTSHVQFDTLMGVYGMLCATVQRFGPFHPCYLPACNVYSTRTGHWLSTLVFYHF